MSFFSKSPAAPLCNESEQQRNARFKRMQCMYYVCRTSLNVVKKTIMDAGVLDAKQLGVISSALLSNYEGPSITINNDPTPEGAQAF